MAGEVQLEVRFRLDPEADADAYVAQLADGHGRSVAMMSIPRAAADPVVMGAAKLMVEFQPGGTVAVYADATDLGTLVSGPLAELVEDALSLVAIEEAGSELPALEAALESALQSVRRARQRLG